MKKIIIIFILFLTKVYCQEDSFQCDFRDSIKINSTILLDSKVSRKKNKVDSLELNCILNKKDFLFIKINSDTNFDYYFLVYMKKYRKMLKKEEVFYYPEIYLLDKNKGTFFSLNFNNSNPLRLLKLSNNELKLSFNAKFSELENIVFYDKTFIPLKSLVFTGENLIIDNVLQEHRALLVYNFFDCSYYLFKDYEYNKIQDLSKSDLRNVTFCEYLFKFKDCNMKFDNSIVKLFYKKAF